MNEKQNKIAASVSRGKKAPGMHIHKAIEASEGNHIDDRKLEVFLLI